MGVSDDLKNVSGAAESAGTAVEDLTESLIKGGNQFEKMVGLADGMGESIKDLGKALEGLSDKTFVFSMIGSLAGLGIAFIGDLGKSIGELGKTYYAAMGFADAFSAGHRELYGDLHDLGVQFGYTFQEAQNFGRGLLDIAATVSSEKFGFINSTEIIEATRAFAENRVSLDKLGDTIETTAGNFDMMTAATLQAGVSGLDTATYFSTLSNAMIKQGLDSQSAMEQISGFKNISDKTGLSTKSVADSLNSLGNNFARLGVSADFGRPILESFAHTVNDMGLGIENAGDLANNLSTSLLKLASDYSTMYVTAQRGNLGDMLGGGGALGASIQMQARLLEAEGSPEAQAEIGADLATALRDTIASFAGGDIVTVQEAARSPELETQFYTQQKLLEQMYGLDTDTATRTLDLLQRMGEAMSTGDQELAASLGADLQDAIQGRNETMDLQEKANATLGGILAEAMLTNESLLYLTRETVGEAAINEIQTQSRAAYDKMAKSLESANVDASTVNTLAKSRDVTFSNLEEVLKKGKMASSGEKDALAGGNVGEESITAKIGSLIDKSKELISAIERLIGVYGGAEAKSSGPTPGKTGGAIGSNASGG